MRNRIAVCIHVYYEDMWDYLAGYLANIPEGADYYITCREEIHTQISEWAARDLGATAEVVVMPNLGMDVLPFLMLCREKELHRYDAVLKLHTKNQKSKLRADQGRIMLDGLCGSTALVKQIVDVFLRDPDAGMVGTAFQLRSANALMYGNRDRMAALLASLDIDLIDWPFFTGTMFWIAGRMLQDIAALSPQFLEESRKEAKSSTGGDGALAHTLERVFGALSQSLAANTYVTERQGPESASFLVLPLREHGPANSWRLLELGSADLVRRHMDAGHWCRAIAKSGYFETEHYREVAASYAVPGMDDIYHFVLYGDLFELDPSPRFSTTYYQLRRRDVVRENICSLAHYIQTGHREDSSAQPSEEEWQALSKRHFLFDPTWYQNRYADVGYSGVEPEQHYKLIGRRLGRMPSAKFRSDGIPVLARDADPKLDDMTCFLQRHFIEENLLYAVLKRAAQNGDYAIMPSVAKRILSKFGTSRALNEALATSYTLSGQWDRAGAKWAEFWEEAERGEDSCRHGTSVLQFDRSSKKLDGFDIVQPYDLDGASAAKRSELGGKICIYTTLFGEIDKLNPVMNPVDGVDYLCFTDRPRRAEGWTQIIVDPQQPSDNLNAKIFKILPHKYLQDYEYSMFVDANTVFLGRTGELIDLCLAGGDFVMWQHPLRDDTFTEVCAIISHRRHGPENILAQIRHYAERGLPRNVGMFEASFIWRRHMASGLCEFMEKWWEHICEFSSRDQISLSYLVWETGTRPCLLSSDLGTSRENIYFFKAPHRNGRVRSDDEVNPLLTSPALRNRPRDITFLYHEQFAGAGSTVLRGQQLSGIVAGRYKGEREVRYISDPADIRDEVVILAKGFLKMTTPEDLRELRRHNILIADFVDEPPRKELIGEIDMLMASSLRGYRDYLTSFPDVPAAHVTHHVDTRIPRCEEAVTDVFRAGYFGELVNTIQGEEIEKLVEFNHVDTSKQTNNWIDALAHYNFHYAFRRTRGIDGAKPFLKGFVAAHRGANMMIQKSAGDASFYLGADYPYLMEDDAGPEEIVDALTRARDTIGGPEWHYGREIMRDVQARSSLDHVLGEFDDMLKVL